MCVCVRSCVWFLVGVVWQLLADERDSVDLAPQVLWRDMASVCVCVCASLTIT